MATGRKMLGETNPANSAPGTIRGDFCVDIGRCSHTLCLLRMCCIALTGLGSYGLHAYVHHAEELPLPSFAFCSVCACLIHVLLPHRRNIIHGSDAVESAQKEIALWFPEGVTKWQPATAGWVYENPQE